MYNEFISILGFLQERDMGFTKKTIRDIDIAGKRLLVRADFNVEMGKDGQITNDYKIRAVLPTLQFALEQGAGAIAVLAHGPPRRG